MNIQFSECPKCHGYGVLDSGRYCEECGGTNEGRGGYGSGELMTDRDTGQRITAADLVRMAKERDGKCDGSSGQR